MDYTWWEQEVIYWARAFLGAILTAAALGAVQFLGAHIPDMLQFLGTMAGGRVALAAYK